MNIGAAKAIMESLSEKDISDLTGYLIQHRLDQVLSGVDDVDSMANNAISAIFSNSNTASEVSVIAPGIIAVPCYTQYMGNKKKHRCANCTVKNGDQESWCWEESSDTSFLMPSLPWAALSGLSPFTSLFPGFVSSATSWNMTVSAISE